MTITYYGHSCFTIESDGFTIALDPYNTDVPGYEPLSVNANAVYCSHGHGDHAYTQAVTIVKSPTENPFTVTEIASFHDDKQGAKRGLNTIRIFEAEGKKVAHIGDLGCELTADQIEALQGLDAILIPVGGFYTIDWEQANAIVKELHPKRAIPMHFRDGNYGYPVIEDIKNMTLNDCFKRIKVHESIEI